MTMTMPNMTMIARNWRDLIRPRGIRSTPRPSPSFYAKFVCEPLERGFGITLGNSLRRVLLSSLQGAAITAVRIEGALHEFTTIRDVVEDVTDIILNLKEVVFKAAQAKTYIVRIDKEGPGPRLRARHPARRRPPGAQPRPPHRDARQEGARCRWSSRSTSAAATSPPRRTRPRRCRSAPSPSTASSRPIRKVNYTVTNARVGQVDRLRQADARGLDQRVASSPRTRSPMRPRS